MRGGERDTSVDQAQVKAAAFWLVVGEAFVWERISSSSVKLSSIANTQDDEGVGAQR